MKRRLRNKQKEVITIIDTVPTYINIKKDPREMFYQRNQKKIKIFEKYIVKMI